MMQTEITSQAILARLKNISEGGQEANPPAAVGLGQIMMWLVPQKAEHDDDYDINPGYFEGLLQQAMGELLARGYVTPAAEDADSQSFYLTQKGAQYVEELARSGQL